LSVRKSDAPLSGARKGGHNVNRKGKAGSTSWIGKECGASFRAARGGASSARNCEKCGKKKGVFKLNHSGTVLKKFRLVLEEAWIQNGWPPTGKEKGNRSLGQTEREFLRASGEVKFLHKVKIPSFTDKGRRKVRFRRGPLQKGKKSIEGTMLEVIGPSPSHVTYGILRRSVTKEPCKSTRGKGKSRGIFAESNLIGR